MQGREGGRENENFDLSHYPASNRTLYCVAEQIVCQHQNICSTQFIKWSRTHEILRTFNHYIAHALSCSIQSTSSAWMDDALTSGHGPLLRLHRGPWWESIRRTWLGWGVCTFRGIAIKWPKSWVSHLIFEPLLTLEFWSGERNPPPSFPRLPEKCSLADSLDCESSDSRFNSKFSIAFAVCLSWSSL